MKEEETTMEWHESIRRLLSSSATGNADGDGGGDGTEQKSPLQVSELLVVDRAKLHRSLHDSQSTEAETQNSRSSSINEDELSILFEEVDLYDEEGTCARMNQSFPKTRSSRSARRRWRARKISENMSVIGKNPNAEKMSDVLASWGSNSDSILDYASLDDMLREENSQTASALLNVFRPARRQSAETIASDLDSLIEETFEVSEDEDKES